MSTEILEEIAQIAAEAGKGFQDIWACLLLLAPAVLFIGYAIVYFSNAAARGRGRVAYLAFSDISLLTFAALALCAYAPEDAVASVLYLGVALFGKVVYLLLFGILSLFPKKRTEKSQKNELPTGEYIDMSAQFPAPAPTLKDCGLKKVRCFTEPEYAERECESYASDVRLDHIFSVIERLKGISLGAGDRLEVEKYEDLLTVYKNKNALSSQEAQTLNDILASLLKMMAKYDL